MANVKTRVSITPPRVPFTDERTGLISREWYLFFLGLYNTASDVADNPDSVAASYNSIVASVTEIQKQTQDLQLHPYEYPHTNNEFKPITAGVVVLPAVTDNGDGTLTIDGSGVANLYPSSTVKSNLKSFEIPGKTFTPTDSTVSYIYADYNNEVPQYVITTNRDDITTHHLMDRVVVFTVEREGTTLRIYSWDQIGFGLSEKMLDRQFDVETRFRASLVSGGPMISDTGSNHFALSAGRIWDPIKYYDLLAFASQTDRKSVV